MPIKFRLWPTRNSDRFGAWLAAAWLLHYREVWRYIEPTAPLLVWEGHQAISMLTPGYAATGFTLSYQLSLLGDALKIPRAGFHAFRQCTRRFFSKHIISADTPPMGVSSWLQCLG